MSLITFTRSRFANEWLNERVWEDPLLQHKRDQTCDNDTQDISSIFFGYIFHDTWSGACDLSETIDSAENNHKRYGFRHFAGSKKKIEEKKEWNTFERLHEHVSKYE